MKIQTKVSDFIKLISISAEVSKSAVLKTSIGVFIQSNKLTFIASDNELKILAFSGQVGIETVIDNFDDSIKILSSGKVTVVASDLISHLNSFDENEIVVLEYNNVDCKEFTIYKLSDKTEFQSLPVLDMEISLPDVSEKKIKSFTIDRRIFVSGAEKILFALGIEEQKPQFLYWVFRASSKKVRFAAGDNRRFAIHDLSGVDIVSNLAKSTNVLFPKDHTNILLKILNSCKDDMFELNQSESEKTETYFMQVLIGNHRVILTNMNPNIEWPDESRILSVPYDNKAVIDSKDFSIISKAIGATFLDGIKKEMKPHEVELVFDFNNKILIAKVDDISKTSRKIPLLDYVSKNNNFSCKFTAMYLQEIASKGEKGLIQIEFNNAIEQADGSKRNKPFLFKFFAENKISDLVEYKNNNGINEALTFIVLPR